MASYGNVYRQCKGFWERLGASVQPASSRGSGGSAGRLRAHLAQGLGVCLVAALGCGPIPAVTKTGLPRVSRYASPAQLDWMLARYAELGSAATGDAELHEQACLGWERAVFDLESGRRYPVLLRMSTDSSALATILQDLPTLARRHPRPSSCATAAAPADAASAAAAAQANPATNPSVATPSDNPVPPAQDSGLSGAAAAGVAQVDTPAAKSEASPAAPARADAPSGSLSAPVAAGPVAAPESSVAKQRRLLARLRAAVGMDLMPSISSEQGSVAASTLRPELGSGLRPELGYEVQSAAIAELTELSQSDLPAIRLRARFHLLGLCTLAVEASDRYVINPEAQPLALAAACDSLAGAPGKSVAASPGKDKDKDKDLRVGQRRLLWSLLSSWRIKNSEPLEPMSDIVIALASFAARDNPVVDGPRGSR